MSSIAKISSPALRRTHRRQRLVEQIDASPEGTAVWVWGPPGSGKTTVAADYMKASDHESIWYQLDAVDSDVATFFYYLDAASKSRDRQPDRPLPSFSAEHMMSLSSFARQFFEVFFTGFQAPFVFVLDDYHVIPDQAMTHQVVMEAVASLPRGGRIVITSRQAPPEAFARLRANQKIEMIDWTALQLTEDDVDGIAAKWWGKPQTAPIVRQLQSKSGGWVAGLILLLESGLTNTSDSEARPGDTPQVVFDYFAAEFFARQDNARQQLLLKLALLPRSTAEMACQMTDDPEAGSVLEKQYEDQFFIDREVGPTGRYAFHQLFREFLLSEGVKQIPAALWDQLQYRAAEILEQDGQIEAALNLLTACKKWDQTSRLICQKAPNMMARGQHAAVGHWIQAVPVDVVERMGWLQYWAAASSMFIDPATARERFAVVFDRFEQDNDVIGMYLSWVGFADSCVLGLTDYRSIDPWIDRLDHLIAVHGSPVDPEIDGRLAVSVLHTFTFRCPERRDLSVWAEKALRYIEALPDGALRLWIGQFLILYYIWSGQHQLAARLIRQLDPIRQSLDVAPLTACMWDFAAAMYAWHQADTKSTLKIVNDSLDEMHACGVHLMDGMLLGQGALAHAIDGDLEQARVKIDRMMQVIPVQQGPGYGFCHFLAARTAMLEGNYEQATSHINTAIELTPTIPSPHTFCQLYAAQIALRCHDVARAQGHLQVARELAQRIGSDYLLHDCFLLEAELALEEDQLSAVRIAISQAFGIAKNRQFTVTYLWDRSVMARLCVIALDAEIEVEFVQGLIRRTGLHSPADAESERWPWPVKISTFGPMRILLDGELFVASGKSQKRPLSLLKLLLAEGSHTLTVAKAIDTLWPDSDGDAAQSAMKTTLHRLRKLLGLDKAVRLEQNKLSLDPRYCWSDTAEFERQIKKWTDSSTNNEMSQACAEGLRSALDLYPGMFISDDTDSLWLMTPRRRLHRLYMTGLARLGDHLESCQAWGQAIQLYEKAMTIDPLVEEVYQRLMACHLQQGHRSEAHRVFQQCTEIFDRQLGVKPSKRTEKLLEC